MGGCQVAARVMQVLQNFDLTPLIALGNVDWRFIFPVVFQAFEPIK